MHDVGRLVVNKTGVSGEYYFPLMECVPPREASAEAPSVPEELRDVAGLELKPATDAIRVLMIDHVQKPTGDSGGDRPATAQGAPAPPPAK
jgi:uncharacterized protein (TIGR03435 family)